MTKLRRSSRVSKPVAQVVTPEVSKKPRKKRKTTKPKMKVAKAAATVSLVAATAPNAVSLVTVSPHFAGTKRSLQSPPLAAKGRKTDQRTTSFDAMWAGSFPHLKNKGIKVHTLILGTHPSIKSLAESQYYGHSMNAFWWIVGDCLGFRRASGMKTSGDPYQFTTHVRYDESCIVPYEQQLETLVSRGFALWDVVHSCERKGSLDQDIKEEVPNDISSFCKEHPNIQRIVLANGGTGSTMFKKHFKSWWKSGELQPGMDEKSQEAFGKIARSPPINDDGTTGRVIHCISAISVSPAAARVSYQEKRDFWEEHVYGPGLEDYYERMQQKN